MIRELKTFRVICDECHKRAIIEDVIDPIIPVGWTEKYISYNGYIQLCEVCSKDQGSTK